MIPVGRKHSRAAIADFRWLSAVMLTVAAAIVIIVKSAWNSWYSFVYTVRNRLLQ